MFGENWVPIVRPSSEMKSVLELSFSKNEHYGSYAEEVLCSPGHIGFIRPQMIISKSKFKVIKSDL